MEERTIAGKLIHLDNNGYMTDLTQWNLDVAKELAKEDNIALSEKHLEVIKLLQDLYHKNENITMRKIGKSGIVDIKGLYELFPGGPLKLASKYAGIPKPQNCV